MTGTGQHSGVNENDSEHLPPVKLCQCQVDHAAELEGIRFELRLELVDSGESIQKAAVDVIPDGRG